MSSKPSRFTMADVYLLRGEAVNCHVAYHDSRRPAQRMEEDDAISREWLRDAARYHSLADRIEALLPPISDEEPA